MVPKGRTQTFGEAAFSFSELEQPEDLRAAGDVEIFSLAFDYVWFIDSTYFTLFSYVIVSLLLNFLFYYLILF